MIGIFFGSITQDHNLENWPLAMVSNNDFWLWNEWCIILQYLSFEIDQVLPIFLHIPGVSINCCSVIAIKWTNWWCKYNILYSLGVAFCSESSLLNNSRSQFRKLTVGHGFEQWLLIVKGMMHYTSAFEFRDRSSTTYISSYTKSFD